MGGCNGKEDAQQESQSPSAVPAWTVTWNTDLMAQGLKGMEDAVSRAETSQLAPSRPWPPAPDPKFATMMNEWAFDLFMVPYDDLPAVAYSALTMHAAVSDPANKLDLTKLWRYVCEVATWYHPRPFHNFRHAVDVLLATSTLIRFIQVDHPEHFSDTLEVAALLVSALVHDTDHPGVMNTYMIATKHVVSTRTNAPEDATPVAVLEHHHARVAIALLKRPELNFLSELPEADSKRFIDLIWQNVLNTDVTTTMTAAKSFSGNRRPSVTVVDFQDRASSNATVTTAQVTPLAMHAKSLC